MALKQQRWNGTGEVVKTIVPTSLAEAVRDQAHRERISISLWLRQAAEQALERKSLQNKKRRAS